MIVSQPPLLTILLLGETVRHSQVTLEGLERLTIFQAYDVVWRYRLVERYLGSRRSWARSARATGNLGAVFSHTAGQFDGFLGGAHDHKRPFRQGDRDPNAGKGELRCGVPGIPIELGWHSC
jgi:hypothetical protein